jgi:hypothetical protein
MAGVIVHADIQWKAIELMSPDFSLIESLRTAKEPSISPPTEAPIA